MLQGYDSELWAHLEQKNKVHLLIMLLHAVLVSSSTPEPEFVMICALLYCRSTPNSMLSDG